jgi:mono/diheme cytochrome c family protein
MSRVMLWCCTGRLLKVCFAQFSFWLIIFGGFMSVQGCSREPSIPKSSVRWTLPEATAAIKAGQKVLLKHECRRCHVIDDIAPASRPRDCVGCHNFIKKLSPDDDAYRQIAAKYGNDVITRYQNNITHLRSVPDLTRIAARVRPDWLATFLAEPFDVRPALADSMIRHRLNPAEQQAVVRYFAAVADAEDPYAPGWLPPTVGVIAPAKIDAGEKLFRERGCVACHTFGNRETGISASTLSAGGPAAALAPNLRFVKERTRPDVLVDWIMNPTQIAPHTLMPSMGLDRMQAESIRDYLLGADPLLHTIPATVTSVMPKLLMRKVSYGEMKEKVLGKVCVHCHMNSYEKDPGPGNLGGLGYAGAGLMMRTYESLVSGALSSDGRRYSVLQPRSGEMIAPILQAMLRRRVEEARDHVEAFADHVRPAYPVAQPGMPLGLPSMNDEELALLATWIAQGCKGPDAASGKSGVNDGYLVPDGPIDKNYGCELREPGLVVKLWQ